MTSRPPSASLWRLILALVLAVCLGELAVHWLVHTVQLVPTASSYIADALVLTLVLAPVIYLLVMRRMLRDQKSLSELAERLSEAHGQLENRVRERTAELEKANAALSTEVVQRRRAQADLSEARTRYLALFSESPDGVLLVDPGTWLPTEFNEAAHRMLGYERDEFAAMRLPQHGLPGSESLDAAISRALEKTAGSVEVSLVTRDGERRDALLSVRHMELGGRWLMHLVWRDISDRKAVQAELKEAHRKLVKWVADLERRNREIIGMAEMIELLQACRSVDEAQSVIREYMRRLFPELPGTLYMFNDARTSLEPASEWGHAVDAATPFQPDDCWAMRRSRPHLSAPDNPAAICPHLGAASRQRHLCLPVTGQGEALGVLVISGSASAEGGARIDDQTRQFATTVAEHVALALNNLRLRDILRHQAIRDPLTSLFNRRYMVETLDRELRRAERQAGNIGVIMLDVDHFKAFNDSYGHDAGDTLLRMVGMVLRRHCRESDIACRFGGEEFTLILPDVPLEIAERRAEELRIAIRSMQVHHLGQDLGSVTLSAGVAAYPSHGVTGDELIRAADAALYEAKRAGRDRVVAAAPSGPASGQRPLPLQPPKPPEPAQPHADDDDLTEIRRAI